MRQILLIFLLIAALDLAACNTADPSQDNTPIAEQPTHTATPTSTIPAPTARPTKRQPSATRTPTSPPASPTLAPTLTPTPHIYVAQEFDTLFGIAFENGTTVERLVALNDIDKNNFLQIGQELIIPTAPEVNITPTPDEKTSITEGDANTITNEKTSTTGVDSTSLADTTTTTSPANVQAAEFPSTSTPETDVAANEPVAGDSETPPTAEAKAAPPPAPPTTSPTANKSPLPVISHPANINPLTGLPVDDPAKLQRRPLMVRIGNDVGARQSQVGLNSADMVYEEITEWWVTRFTAIFLAQTPDTIGPVRSARLINTQLGPQYQGALAHSGGSDPVRWEISQAAMANLDEFYNAAPYFYRPNEGWQTRLAINGQAARDYMAAMGLDAPVIQQGFLFSETAEGGEWGEDIYIPYPHVTSFTEWHYDAASDKYLRWINASPLYDFNGGQIAATNVIIYFAEHQATDIVEDSNGATSIRTIVNGRGPAWFFRDGQLHKGFWETDGTRSPYFTYEDGSPYSLKPGNTWVEVTPTYFTIGLNSPDEADSSR